MPILIIVMPCRKADERVESGRLLVLMMVAKLPFKTDASPVAKDMKTWKGNGNTTKLLFSLNGLKE